MKLFYCRHCQDIRALRSESVVRCACRASAGRYRSGGPHADITGPCVALGITSASLDAALAAPPRGDGLGNRLEAFVIPETSTTVRRLDEIAEE